MEGSLTRQAMGGVFWTLVLQLSTQGVQYVVQLVLTRFLLPHDFGEVNLAILVTGFVAMVSGLGLAQALIQRQEIDQGHKDAAFWVGLLVGIVLSLLMAAIAPLMGMVYPEYPRIAPLLLLAGLAFPFTSVTSVQSSLLRREMSFRRIAIIELLGGTIVQAIVSMTLAVLGFGPYAIVLGHLSRLPLMTLLYFRATDYRPTRRVDRTKLRELFGFGGHMTLAGVVDFAAYSVPDLLISKLLKSTAFGLYSWSTKLVTFPLFKIATAVTAVGFPTFSKIQEDLPRMRRAYLRMVTCIAAICFPMMGGLACLAEEVVTTLFRAEWHGTAPIIEVLCLMGAMLSVGTTVGTIYQSRGRVDIEWKLNLVQGVVTVFALLAAPRDVVSMTWFVVAVRAAMMLPTQTIANRLIGLPHRDYVLAIVPPTVLTLVMSAAVLGTTWILSGFGPGIRLAAGTLAGATVYAACLRFATPRLYAMLKEVVVSRRSSKPDPVTGPGPGAEDAEEKKALAAP